MAHQRKTRQIIRSFEASALKKRSFTTRFADSLTKFFGSIGFLILNLLIFTAWIFLNSGKVPGIPTFDPYPYVLLITMVSLEAIILTTIVLMSQNRQSQIGTLRDELQLQVELITEKEITKILILLKKLMDENKIEIRDEELSEMLETVDTSYIEKELEKQLSDQETSLKKTMTEPIAKVEKTLTPKK